MADNDHVWNLETCKKNALKFKSSENLETCKENALTYELWSPKLGKFSNERLFPSSLYLTENARKQTNFFNISCIY